MRTLSIIIALLYTFTLTGYSVMTAAHIAAHKISAFLPVHDHDLHHHHHKHEHHHHHHHHDDHHHTLEDHHYVAKTLAQHTPDAQPTEELALANFLSFFETATGFTFTPAFRYRLTFGWRQPFAEQVFLKPFKPPPLHA